MGNYHVPFLGGCDMKSLVCLLHIRRTMQPSILLLVSYQDVEQRLRSLFYDSSWDNVAALVRGAAKTARPGCDCQHQAVQALG
jgi:hypothetical protein